MCNSNQMTSQRSSSLVLLLPLVMDLLKLKLVCVLQILVLMHPSLLVAHFLQMVLLQLVLNVLVLLGRLFLEFPVLHIWGLLCGSSAAVDWLPDAAKTPPQLVCLACLVAWLESQRTLP